MAKTNIRGTQILDASVDLTVDITGTLPVSNGGTGATTLTGVLVGNGASAVTAVAAPTGTIVGTSDSQTLTNKTLTPRVNTTASSATPSINTDTTDIFTITALAAAITSMTTNLTGSPVNGQRLTIRFKDNGTARAITWGASFASSGTATLLATTVVNKTHLVNLLYDSTAAKWICTACDLVGY